MFCLFVPCLSLLLQLGLCTLWGGGWGGGVGGGGAHSASLFVCFFAALKDSECGILMPSSLLVWQIPYRKMRSLGLKVSIRRGSRLPCLVLCGYLGACRDSQLVRAVPDSTGGFSWS